MGRVFSFQMKFTYNHSIKYKTPREWDSLKFRNLTTTYLHLNSLNSCGIDDDSSVPFLTFNQFIKTHKLNPSQYNNPLTEDRKVIHNEVFRLYNKGLGYKRIHRNMVENGFKVAKSSTTIDCIIKKRLKREAFLNQPITNEYRNYDIEFLRVE